MSAPTYSQINCIYRWFSWNMPTALAQDAVHWLKEHKTSAEVYHEVGRIKKLYDEHKLTKETAFDSPIWEDYEKKYI